MRFMKCSMIAVVTLVVLSGCSASQDSGGLKAGHQADTPGQALGRLSADDRGKFDEWTKSLEKNCEATEIFGGASDTKSLDVGVLLNRTGHSLVLHGSDGGFAVLTDPSFPLGEGSSHFETSVSVSGQGTYQLSVETRYNSGNCDVYLFGQKVYSTTLVRSLKIMTAYDPAHPHFSILSRSPHLNPASNSDSAEWVGSGIGDAIQTALRPTGDSGRWVAGLLGINPDRASRYFSDWSGGSLTGVLDLGGSSKAAPFGFGDEGILGSRSMFQTMGTQGAQQEVGVRLRLPMETFGNETNSADNGFLNVRAAVQLAPSGSQGRLDVKVASLAMGRHSPYDDSEAASCFLRRMKFLKGMDSGASPFSPSFPRATGPCDLLSTRFETALLNSSDALAEVRSRFYGVQGSMAMQYQGWDTLLTDWTKLIVQGGGDLQSVLDPSASSPLIAQIAARTRTVQDALTRDTMLSSERDGLLGMAVGWSLRGQMISRSAILEILDTLNGTIDPFGESTESLLDAFASDPGADANWDLLKFARENINDRYKRAALVFHRSGLGFGMDDWTESRFSQVIQKEYSVDQFSAWAKELNAAKAFAGRDQARKSSDEYSYDGELHSLIQRALDEKWTDATYRLMEAIAPIEKMSPFCLQGTTSVAGLVNCGSSVDLYSKRDGKFLDPRFGDRYGRASSEFQSDLQKLQDNEFYSDRSSLMDAFFEPLWKSCRNSEFDRRLRTLHDLVEELSHAPFSQRFELEEKLRDTLRDCAQSR